MDYVLRTDRQLVVERAHTDRRLLKADRSRATRPLLINLVLLRCTPIPTVKSGGSCRLPLVCLYHALGIQREENQFPLYSTYMSGWGGIYQGSNRDNNDSLSVWIYKLNLNKGIHEAFPYDLKHGAHG